MKREKVYIISSPERNPALFILNIFQSLSLFIRTKPDVIISTGAGVAIAMCYIAKFFGRKIVFYPKPALSECLGMTVNPLYFFYVRTTGKKMIVYLEILLCEYL